MEKDADLLMAQLMPLPFTVSCFSKIWILPFWYRLTQVVPEKRAVKWVCVCVHSLKMPKMVYSLLARFSVLWLENNLTQQGNVVSLRVLENIPNFTKCLQRIINIHGNFMALIPRCITTINFKMLSACNTANFLILITSLPNESKTWQYSIL